VIPIQERKVTVPAQEKLSPTEQYLAYVIGGGVIIAMAALFFAALGTVQDDRYTISVLIVGLAVIVSGAAAWMVLLRPWEKFDDLKTPYYTGHDEHVQAGAAAAQAAPAEARAETPRPAGPDDLTLIEGIGPKSAAALAAAGITSFAQVASMVPQDLETLLRQRKVRLVGSTDTWPQQARLAASGDLTALEDFQKRIKGGILHDDLTQIEGIGPKAQAALYQAGIRTYHDLAQSTPEALRQILVAARLRTVSPQTWPEQAALIVSDNLTGLKKLQDEL
jgi:predicted flap endonuclease-1-like 5' DNA nuclease